MKEKDTAKHPTPLAGFIDALCMSILNGMDGYAASGKCPEEIDKDIRRRMWEIYEYGEDPRDWGTG